MAKPKFNTKDGNGKKGGKFQKDDRDSKFNPSRRNSGKRPDPCANNDLSWYSHNSELLASAARFPFTWKPGAVINGPVVDTTVVGSESAPMTVRIPNPGVCRMEYVYTIGHSDSATSPGTICARQMFQVIRDAFSGNLDEDAPDLFMYTIAIDMIHAYIAWLKRIYRTVNAHTGDNFMFPEKIYEGGIPQGALASLPYNDVRRDKIRFWGLINTLVHLANTFRVPDSMDIFKRHRWMNEWVYSDINEVRGQNYIFAPTGFWFVDDTGPQGTELKWHYLASDLELESGNAVDKLYGVGLKMIQALSEWGDSKTIDGHLKRAYEGTTWYTSPLLEQFEIIAPAYSDEVLTQIHNINVLNVVGGDITQNAENGIIYHSLQLGSYATAESKVLLDMDGSNPDGGSITIASRLAPCAVIQSLPSGDTLVITSGTEVVNNLWITVPNFDTAGVWIDPSKWEWKSVKDFDLAFPISGASAAERGEITQASLTSMRNAMLLQAWRRAPKLLIQATRIAYTNEEATYYGNPFDRLMWYTGESDNIAILAFNEMEPLHRVCLYSEFGVFIKG